MKAFDETSAVPTGSHYVDIFPVRRIWMLMRSRSVSNWWALDIYGAKSIPRKICSSWACQVPACYVREMESKWQIYRNYPPKSSGIWIEILPMMFGAPLSSMIFVMIKRDKICWHLFRRAPSWVSRAFTIRPGSWCTWPKVQPTFFAKPTHGHWGPLQIAQSFQLRCSYRQVLIELFTLVLQVERYSLNWRPGLDESMCLGFENLKLWSGYPTGKRNWSLVKAWYFPFSKVFKLGTFSQFEVGWLWEWCFWGADPGQILWCLLLLWDLRAPLCHGCRHGSAIRDGSWFYSADEDATHHLGTLLWWPWLVLCIWKTLQCHKLVANLKMGDARMGGGFHWIVHVLFLLGLYGVWKKNFLSPRIMSWSSC